MNSATDHGYNIDWSINVGPGLECRQRSAWGLSAYRVLRRHRDHGYWETAITEFPDHPGLIGSIEIKSERDILADAYAP